MTVKSHTGRLVTDSGRVIVTDLTVDEVVDFWREKYDRIFAAEAKARRIWAAQRKPMPSPDEVDAEIQKRQVEWDAYVTEQLKDLGTAK